MRGKWRGWDSRVSNQLKRESRNGADNEDIAEIDACEEGDKEAEEIQRERDGSRRRR